MLDTLLRPTEDAICVLDAQGTFRSMNDSAAAQVGGRPEDFVGKTLQSVFPPDLAQLFTGYVRQVIESRKGLVTEIRKPLGNGLRWHRTVVEPLSDADGNISTVLMIARDITDRKNAEVERKNSEVRYQTLVEQMPAITYTTPLGQDSGVLFVSPQVTELLGFSLEECRNDPGLWKRQLHPADRDRVLRESAETRQGGRNFVSEYRAITKDGRVKWFRDEARIVLDPDGRPLYLQGLMLDITERKAAEGAARRSDTLFRHLFSCSPIGMTLFDTRGKFVDANLAARKIFGVKEQRRDLGYSVLRDPQFPPDAMARLEGGEPVRFEVAYDFDRVRRDRIHDSGRTGIAYLDFSMTPLTDAQSGDRIGYLSQVQEITERKRAEMQVAGLSTQRQLALDAARMGWWQYELATKTFNFDERIQAIFGMEGSKATVGQFFARVHPEDVSLIRAKAAAILGMPDPQPFSVDYRIRLPDGVERWIENLVNLVFEGQGASRRLVGMFGTTRDVTDRKRAEQTLQQSERQARESFEELQKLMDIAPVAILVANDPECKDVSANPAAQRLMRIPDPVNHTIKLPMPFPPPGPRFFQDGNEIPTNNLPLHVATLKGLAVDSVETSVLGPNGRLTTMLESARPLFDASGQIRGGICVALDITERKRVENALRESRQDFEDLLRSLEDGVWAADIDNRQVLYVNPAMENIYGRSRSELLAKSDTWLDFVHPEDRSFAFDSDVQLRNTGHADAEYRIICPDGSIRWVRDRKTVVRDATGKPLRIGGILRDVTNRREADERARHYEHDLRFLTHEILRVEEAERSQLAADLHDGLSQLLSLTRIKLGALDPAHAPADLPQKLGEIYVLLDQAIHEARALTFELSPPVLHELGLPSAAAWLSDQMKRRFGLEVRVEENSAWKQLPKSTNSVLFRCLRELLVNVAKHAHASLAEVRFVQTDHHVSLSVADNGRGFKEGFVSDKPPSSAVEGGFGLFSIRQRLEHLGGQLMIESRPGQGSVVRLDLPLAGK